MLTYFYAAFIKYTSKMYFSKKFKDEFTTASVMSGA